MYENFTDRAIRALRNANNAAIRYGQMQLSAELIFLGIAMVGEGNASFVLMNAGLDMRQIRLEIEKLIPMNSQLNAMFPLPKSSQAAEVIRGAILEAVELRKVFVATEHLLLSLLHQTEGIISKVFENLNINRKEMRISILDMIGEIDRSNDNSTPSSNFRASSADQSNSNSSQALQIYRIADEQPPLCEPILTIYGESRFDGRDWHFRNLIYEAALPPRWWSYLPIVE